MGNSQFGCVLCIEFNALALLTQGSPRLPVETCTNRFQPANCWRRLKWTRVSRPGSADGRPASYWAEWLATFEDECGTQYGFNIISKARKLSPAR